MVSEKISIDLSHYNLKYRVILKDDLIEKLSRLFKEDILTNEIRTDKLYLKDFDEVLDFLKNG